MIIIDYWQQVSKHYLLSHLLLSAIAVGYGFSSQGLSFSAPLLDRTVNMIIRTNTNLAKVSQAVSMYMLKKKQASLLAVLRSSRLFYHKPYHFPPLQPLRLKDYFLVANIIRAGP